MILLVNKDNIFNEDMISSIEMVEYERYDEKIIYVERETLEHFKQLQAHLRVDDIEIELEDGYRSLESQESLFLSFMNKYGIDYAEEVVAMPGTSEHHTGYAIDIILIKDGNYITENEDLLKEEVIFNKIHKSLKYFGFILRYPKGKEDITGYSYEPWHFRYVGKETMDFKDNETLEEYLVRK